MQECTQDYFPIHCYLHLQLDPALLPKSLCEHAKGFCDGLGNFPVQGSIVAQDIDKIELFHSHYCCVTDDNRWLIHDLSLGEANCKAKMSACSRKVIHIALDVLMGMGSQGTVISKQKFP